MVSNAVTLVLAVLLAFLVTACQDRAEPQRETTPESQSRIAEPSQPARPTERQRSSPVGADRSNQNSPHDVTAIQAADTAQGRWPRASVGIGAPEFESVLLDGSRWSLIDSRGTPVLVLIADDGEKSIRALRDIRELQELSSEGRFQLIAVVATDSEHVARELLRKVDWRAPVIWDQDATVTERFLGQDENGPAHLLLDVGGTVRRIWGSAPTVEEMETALQELGRPLDLGNVNIKSDQTDWEVRQIAEGVAAVISYADHLGLPRLRPTTVFSYRDLYHGLGLLRGEGGHWMSGWLLRRYWNDTQLASSRIYLPRSDRFSAALALAKSYVYPYGLESPARLDPLVLAGLTYHFALHALEHAGYGLVHDQLTHEVAAWQSSGHAWMSETIYWALTGEMEESTNADNLSIALDAEAQGINQWTARLFGTLALEWLGVTSGQVINEFHSHPVASVPRPSPQQASSLLSLDLDSFETNLRRTGVIPDGRPRLQIEVKFSDGSAQAVQRVFWCAILREWHGYVDGPLPWWPHSLNRGTRPECYESAIQETGSAAVTLPAGRYDLMYEIGDRAAFVGAFGVTPFGIKPALLDGVLPGYRLIIEDNQIRILEGPGWTSISVVGFTDYWPGDSLCLAAQRRHWCWRWGPSLSSSVELAYGIPEGRYWLFANEARPGMPLALVELSGPDIEIVERFRGDLALTVDNEAVPSTLIIESQ